MKPIQSQKTSLDARTPKTSDGSAKQTAKPAKGAPARPDGLFEPTFIPRPVPGARPDHDQYEPAPMPRPVPGLRPDGLYEPVFIPRPVPGQNNG